MSIIEQYRKTVARCIRTQKIGFIIAITFFNTLFLRKMIFDPSLEILQLGLIINYFGFIQWKTAVQEQKSSVFFKLVKQQKGYVPKDVLV